LFITRILGDRLGERIHRGRKIAVHLTDDGVSVAGEGLRLRVWLANVKHTTPRRTSKSRSGATGPGTTLQDRAAGDQENQPNEKQTAHGGKITRPAPCHQSAGRRVNLKRFPARQQLLLPGALLVTIQAQLLAALVLVDFRLPAFLD
jgi:hypothetical protein